MWNFEGLLEAFSKTFAFERILFSSKCFYFVFESIGLSSSTSLFSVKLYSSLLSFWGDISFVNLKNFNDYCKFLMQLTLFCC